MAKRETINYSVLIKREGERLLQCLKDSNLGVITCMGWNGIGRWRIAEYATNIAMDSHLFDVLIWVNLQKNESKSRLKLQRRIAESLEIHLPIMDAEDLHVESETDFDIAAQIYEKLKDTKFLLVVGGASSECELTDLARIGVPNVWRWASSVSKVLSKVVLIGKWKNIKSDRELIIKVDIWSGTTSASDVWDLVCEEAALAAYSPSTNGYFSSDFVIDGLLYLSLSFECASRDHFRSVKRRSCFPGFDDDYQPAIRDHYLPVMDRSNYPFVTDEEWRIRYWNAEDLIGVEMKNDEALAEKINKLLTELEDRSILDWGHEFMEYDIHKIVKLGNAGRLPNFHHRFWIDDTDSLPKEDDDEHGWGSIQRLSLLIRTNINLPLCPKCPNLSTLILRHEHGILEFPQTFFSQMESLRVLDLAYTHISTLPISLSYLSNLKLLMLQSCEKLESLPTCLQALKKLEFLNLSKCRSLKAIPEKSFELMDKLRILDISNTKINSLPSSVSNLHNLQELLLNDCSALTNIPENCFERMSHLHILDLSSATSLRSLPSSLCKSVNLRKLKLSQCRLLKTGVWPQPLRNLTLLEVLDLSYCEELEDVRCASFQDMLPKLGEVHINNTQIPNQLSFRGCQSIKTLSLSYLPNLQVLDLSGTKLQALYLGTWKNSLKRLDILPIKYSDILFEELNWGDDDAGARIWVSDPNFFESTLRYFEGFFEAACFDRFYIRISPYEEEGSMPMTMDKIQDIHLKRSPIVYKGIYNSHSHTQVFPHFSSPSACNRRVEICGGNSTSPKGINGLLARTELITLLFNNSVERLSDLCIADELKDLEECRIASCLKMKNIFSGDYSDSDILSSLEVIWASDLPQLTAMCGGIYGDKSFELLSHIYLEHCPRLETLFTSAVYLESLKTLEIRFCYKLKNVFEEGAVGEGSLQSLRSLCLLHAPKLESICNCLLPQLQMVRVSNCPKLRKLPIQVRLVDHDIDVSSSTSPSLPVAEIRGEMEWWKNLEWGDEEEDSIKRPAHFRPWRHAPTTMKPR